MVRLAKTPSSHINIIKSSFQAYPTVVQQAWPLIVLSATVHLINPWFFVLNPAFGFVVLIAFVLITWYLYTAIVCRANSALQGKVISLAEAFRLARQRYLMVLGSNLIFFAIGVFIMLLEFTIDLVFQLVNGYTLFVIISTIIDVFIFVRLYLAIPLIAVDGVAIFAAFEKSWKMVKRNWWRTFIPLLIVGLLILGFEALGILFTGKGRMFLFTIYDFVCQLIFYPLIVSVTLFLLNDLKLRYQRYVQSG